MSMQFKVKKRRRVVFLVATILLGILIFAVAYPMAMGGGNLAAY